MSALLTETQRAELTKLREEADLSIAELASITGVDKDMIFAIEDFELKKVPILEKALGFINEALAPYKEI